MENCPQHDFVLSAFIEKQEPHKNSTRTWFLKRLCTVFSIFHLCTPLLFRLRTRPRREQASKIVSIPKLVICCCWFSLAPPYSHRDTQIENERENIWRKALVHKQETCISICEQRGMHEPQFNRQLFASEFIPAANIANKIHVVAKCIHSYTVYEHTGTCISETFGFCLLFCFPWFWTIAESSFPCEDIFIARLYFRALTVFWQKIAYQDF